MAQTKKIELMVKPNSLKLILSAQIFTLIVSGSLCLGGYNDMLDQAHDYMYTDYNKALKLSRDVLSENPESVKAVWIKSIAYTNIGDLQPDKSKQKAYYKKAEELADRALKLDSEDPGANHAKAIVLGRMAENAGAREGLRLSREVKKYTDKVLELDDEHGGAWFVRGMLMYRIDTLSRMERWIANSFLGGLPFDADQEEAIKALERAVRMNPDNVYFHLEFGKILKEYGKTKRAVKILKSALDLEAKAPKDRDYQKEAEELLGRL